MHGASHLEHFASVNERDPDSVIASVVDWPLGLIRIASTGFWSIAQATEHLADYNRWVARIHGSGLAVSLIVDLLRAPPQSQAATEVLRQSLEGIHRDGDRCALVVPQNIAKMQMRRVLPTDHYAFFASVAAAETWVLAYKQPLLAARLAQDDPHRVRSGRL